MVSVGCAQFEGYGLDDFCARAAELIKQKISMPSADVHFIGGGTHANLTVISSAMRPYEAVIAPESGHIFVHETGAIEAAGHKICTAAGQNGKLCPDDIEALVTAHEDEHMVKPRLVYISQSAECGTIYTKAELEAVSECCKRNALYLFLDGARLGAAMNSDACDMTYGDIAALTDVFYIGGTKNGAMFGEAIVICSDDLKPNFRYHLKQRGAMLAKGAVLGIQFEALLRDGLYDELAKHSCAMAGKMADGILKSGYSFKYPPQTNLIIPIFPSAVAEKLHQIYDFYDWEVSGDMTAARIVTSWATPEIVVDEFINDIAKL